MGLLLQWIRDYRYAFLISGLSNVAAFIACVFLYLQWKRLGGDRAYQPPAVGMAQPEPKPGLSPTTPAG